MSRPPPGNIPSELGIPGVEAVFTDAEGRKTVVFDPNQTRVQWPGVLVMSDVFEQLDNPAKFYEQSQAFLSAAKLLCETAGQSGATGREITWPQASVCYYCVHIATELFLKACLSARLGEVPKTHDLKKLLISYAEILPASEFQFQIPLAWTEAASLFENLLDRTPDQLYRYGVGKDGKGSSKTHQFVPDVLFNRISHLSHVWPRAWNEVGTQRG